MNNQIILLLLGATLALVGGVLSKWIQEHISDKREQNKIIALIRGELINIKNHCDIVSMELKLINKMTIEKFDFNPTEWKKRKYGDLSFMRNNISKLGFLDELTVAEFFQLQLYIRNNDLELEDIINKTAPEEREATKFCDALNRMSRRLARAAAISDQLLLQPALASRKTNLKIGSFLKDFYLK